MKLARHMAITIALLASVASLLPAQWTDHQNASVALGVSDFTTSGAASTSDSSMSRVRGVAIDPTTGKLFAADNDNHRVLRFSSTAAAQNGAAAEAIFGQADGSSTASGSGYAQLTNPNDVAVDKYGNLYVADGGNGRVLRFANASSASTGATATAAFTGLGVPMAVCVDTTARLWVADYSGNKVFRYDAANAKSDGASSDGFLGTGSVGPTQATTGGPSGLAVETNGRLWVACGASFESRVLRFDNAAAKANSANADGLLGHSSYTTMMGGTSQSEFFLPWGLEVSGTDLYVADRGNNRVLRFINAFNKGLGGGADNVYGQTVFENSSSALSQSGMNDPQGLAINASGTLFVGDFNNQRVLRFASIASKADGDPADGVLGQPDFLTANSYRVSGAHFSNAYTVAFDPVSGKLFVGDYSASRILRYSSASALTTGALPEAVIGQADFGSAASGTAADRFYSNYGMAIDNAGRLWVADNSNHRVLRFDNAATCPNGPSAAQVLGQPDFVSNASGTTAATMSSPYGVAVDAAGNLFVSDNGNSRVLIFLNAAAKANGASADSVLGQPDFTSSSTGTTQNTLNYPAGIAVDASGRLWVADNSNNRVLRFDAALTKSNGANADGVLGQADFVTSTNTATQGGMAYPAGVAVDENGALYVVENSNNRVTVFLNAALKTNGANADFVLGQPDFTSSGSATTQNDLSYPNDVAVDNVSGHLWVADGNNNRVLRFTASGALPVQMGSVTAEVRSQSSEVRLSWRTASEVDNAGWEVERRAIGDLRVSSVDYHTIGFVEGAGTSSSPRDYSFTDHSPFDNLQSTIVNRFVYRLKQRDRSGSFAYSHEVEVEVGTAPREFTLGQNFPNPFNPSTTIEFTLPADGRATLKVFDVLGREVRTLVDEELKSGLRHQAVFDASALPSGIYFARLQAGGTSLTRKMQLMK